MSRDGYSESPHESLEDLHSAESDDAPQAFVLGTSVEHVSIFKESNHPLSGPSDSGKVRVSVDLAVRCDCGRVLELSNIVLDKCECGRSWQTQVSANVA